MAKKQAANKKKALRYKQMTAEITFTDGEIKTLTFYKPADCFRNIERIVSEHYADSIRVELF